VVRQKGLLGKPFHPKNTEEGENLKRIPATLGKAGEIGLDHKKDGTKKGIRTFTSKLNRGGC